MATTARSSAQTQPTATNNKYDGYAEPPKPTPSTALRATAPVTPAVPGVSVKNGPTMSTGALLVSGDVEYGAGSPVDLITGFNRPSTPGTKITTAGAPVTPTIPTPATKAASSASIPKFGAAESDSNSLTGGNLNGYAKPAVPVAGPPIGPSGK